MHSSRTVFAFSLLCSFGAAGLSAACGPQPSPVGTGGSGGAGGTGGGTGAQLPCNITQILQRNKCYDCHTNPPQYGAPMSLVSYGDLTATRSARVADLVADRISRADNTRMPPTQYPAMSADDVAAFKAWVQAGTQPALAGQGCEVGGGGSTDDPPFPPDCQHRYQLRAHNLPIVGDQTPFQVPTDGDLGNKYKCFYFTPPYNNGDQALMLKSLFDKTDKRYLHHWILYGRDTPSHAPGTISDCSAAEPGAYFITGWAPGSNPIPMPSDVGMALPPTTGELALEIHYYNPTGDVGKLDQTGVDFCTAPANTRAHTAAISFTGGENICLPAFAQSTVVGQCAPQTTMGDIHVIGVFPHMHQLATRMSIVINRANGTKEVLHDAPFSFQNQVQYAKSALIHPGDTLTTTCFYNNTTPNRVHFGERTQDEMCFGFVAAWPVGALQSNPDLGMLLGPFIGLGQPQRRCLNGAGILESCNGIADYPQGN